MFSQGKITNLTNAVNNATDLSVINAFDIKAANLSAKLDNLTGISDAETKRVIEKAKNKMKELSAVSTPQIGSVSTNLEIVYVRPIEAEAKRINQTLKPSDTVNSTLEARNAYQKITEKMKAATEATTLAERAAEDSLASNGDSLEKKIDLLSKRRDSAEKEYADRMAQSKALNDTLDKTVESLKTLDDELNIISDTADKSLADAKSAKEKGLSLFSRQIKSYLRNCYPID